MRKIIYQSLPAFPGSPRLSPALPGNSGLPWKPRKKPHRSVHVGIIHIVTIRGVRGHFGTPSYSEFKCMEQCLQTKFTAQIQMSTKARRIQSQARWPLVLECHAVTWPDTVLRCRTTTWCTFCSGGAAYTFSKELHHYVNLRGACVHVLFLTMMDIFTYSSYYTWSQHLGLNPLSQRQRCVYSSPSILQTSILRPPLIIRPLDLVPKGNFLC